MKPSVLIVDDEPQFGQIYAQVLAEAGLDTRTATSAAEARALIARALPDMVISDVRMPGGSGIELLQAVRVDHPELPFLLVTAYADVRDAVLSLKLRAIDYLSKPVDLDELIAAVKDTLGLRDAGVLAEIPRHATEGIVAESHAMRATLLDAWRVARSDATVLLTGESGSGKDVVASFIHANSARAGRPFIAVNCAALPANLLASELFGHTRGAFSGAVAQRNGRFREAQTGTLFLDEIGDMPTELQPMLLRAIENREVTPVGSDRPVPVDVRLIAATHVDLAGAVADGTFREDLFYRLNVIAIPIPPLRDRPDDILPLARHFLALAGTPDKRISSAARRLLEAWPWPGNIRELANAITRTTLLSRGDIILPEHLPPAIRTHVPVEPPAEAVPIKTLEESEIEMIRRALTETDGNRTHAADLLGITRRGLIKKIKRFGLDV